MPTRLLRKEDFSVIKTCLVSAVSMVIIYELNFEYIYTILNILIECSQNFTVENMENLESIKRTVESNFKMCLIINTESFHDMEILQIFYKFLQLVCKLKNLHNDFPDFP